MLDPARLTADTLRLLPRKQLSRAMGRVASVRAPSAFVDQAVQTFARIYDVDLHEAIVPSGGYKTFNEFFTRQLKPGARPIDGSPTSLVSPADGRLEDLGPIDGGGMIQVKGRPYDVAELLGGSDTQEAFHAYQGGAYFIVYLSPRDYHRVHAPVAGPVIEMRHVPGTLFPVNSIGLEHVPSLFAVNERVSITQASEQHGLVTTIMVGAIGVGRISVCFDDVVTNDGRQHGTRRYGNEGPPMDRGDELGTFHLGSTAIVFVERPLPFLVQPGATVRMGDAVQDGSDR